MVTMDGHVAVVGLGFGDEGKGATVDALCRGLCRRDGVPSPIAVVRLGGHQAGHNVVEPGGRHHTFSQWGSGTLAGVPTFLSRYMTVEPLGLTAEADKLAEIGVDDPYRMLTVDASCMVVTPFHQRGNLHNTANMAHGTCGKGHGEAVRLSLEHPEEVLRVGFLGDPDRSLHILRLQQDRFHREYPESEGYPISPTDLAETYELFAHVVRVVMSDHLADLMQRGTIIFEHSQGVLLDEWYGFHPHTTWSTTTYENIDRLVAEARGDKPFRLGCLRAYTTRHGAGPFPTENRELALDMFEPHNDGGMQGVFRRGYFDAVLHRYAVEACGGVDGIALSHLDLAPLAKRMCLRYAEEGHEPYVGAKNLLASENMGKRLSMATPVYEDGEATPRRVSEALDVPVVVLADGPTAADRYAAVATHQS